MHDFEGLLTGLDPESWLSREVRLRIEDVYLRNDDQAGLSAYYERWLKMAKDKAATANYVDRAPYEVPERLAQSGRPRALGALVIVLAFCGYLAWLGGPGPYIGGLIAILDLGVMFGMFFGLRPDRLPDAQPQDHRNQPRRRL